MGEHNDTLHIDTLRLFCTVNSSDRFKYWEPILHALQNCKNLKHSKYVAIYSWCFFLMDHANVIKLRYFISKLWYRSALLKVKTDLNIGSQSYISKYVAIYSWWFFNGARKCYKTTSHTLSASLARLRMAIRAGLQVSSLNVSGNWPDSERSVDKKPWEQILWIYNEAVTYKTYLQKFCVKSMEKLSPKNCFRHKPPTFFYQK
jgi:hypothetical protein